MFTKASGKCLCGAPTEGSDVCMCKQCGYKMVGLGRILLALLFVVGGLGFLFDFPGMVAMIDGAGFPAATLLAVIGLVLKLGGGLALLVGYKARKAAMALVIFTLAATLMFHLDLKNQLQLTMFLKNLSIIGGLLYVAAYGGGACSMCKKSTTSEAKPADAPQA